MIIQGFHAETTNYCQSHYCQGLARSRFESGGVNQTRKGEPFSLASKGMLCRKP